MNGKHLKRFELRFLFVATTASHFAVQNTEEVFFHERQVVLILPEEMTGTGVLMGWYEFDLARNIIVDVFRQTKKTFYRILRHVPFVIVKR